MTAGPQRADDRSQATVQLAGILRGTRLRTLDGLLPVEFLSPGDRIITRSGARTLLSVTAVRHQALPVVRILASTLGHGWPETDLLLPRGQSVVIRDWRAQAIFQTAVAHVPAERLLDGQFVLAETVADTALFTLRFTEDEVIWAEGLEIACPALDTEPADPRA